MSTAVDAPENIAWKHVHPLTPLLKGWAVLLVFLWLILQNIGGAMKGISEGVRYAESSSNSLVRIMPVLLPVGGILLFLILAIAIFYLSWRFTEWALDDQAVHYRHGILSKNYRRIPLNRIQSIDIRQPLLARILGLAKLHIESAGGAGSHLDVYYLKITEANDLAKEIRVLASRRKPGETRQPVASASTGTTPAYTPDGAPLGSAQPATEAPAEAFALHELPEFKLYELSSGQLFKSILLSEGPWALLTILGALLAAGAAAIATFVGIFTMTDFEYAGAFGALFSGVIVVSAVGPLIVVLVSTGISRFLREFRFRANVTPHGIRLKSGLIETKAQTIPPGRIHAVQISQPFLWRFTGWWRVKMLIAGQIGGNSSNEEASKTVQSNVLLPVGSYDQALRALWLVVRDMGVENVDSFLQEAFTGTGPAAGFVSVPSRAKWVDPLSWRRRAVASTQTVLVYRYGFLRRKVVIAPHERAQSVTLSQGPLTRILRLADVRLDLVPGQVRVSAKHLEPEYAHQLTLRENQLGRIRSQVEPDEDWATRIVQTFQLTPQS